MKNVFFLNGKGVLVLGAVSIQFANTVNPQKPNFSTYDIRIRILQRENASLPGP
jgi:hypothetical protein